MQVPRDFFERLALSAQMPIGFGGIWSIMLELDRSGPWTAGDVDKRTNVNKGTPRDFLRRLKAACYVEIVGTRITGDKAKQPAPLYRLTRRPLQPPRLRRDGTELPELQRDTIWRTIKMAKAFTVNEIVQLISRPGEAPVKRNAVISYCDALTRARVLSRSGKKGRESHYRLIRNVGAKAPMILSTKLVYDPNEGTLLTHEVELTEVAP